MEVRTIKLKFDRVCECDWCGLEKLVSVTKYASTNSNRLVCEECAKDINEYEEMVFGKKVFELEEKGEN